jgi:hypothetical protein
MKWLLRVLLLALASLSVSLVMAQGNGAGRVLQPGQAVSGTLNAGSVGEVYTFAGGVGQVVSLTVSSQTPLALLLTDSTGQTVAQTAGGAGGASLTNIALTASDTYYVTVVLAPGTTATGAVSFQLTLAIGNAPEATAAATSAPEGTAPATASPEATSAPEGTGEATQQAVPEATVIAQPTTAPGAPETAFTLPGQLVTTTGLQVTLTWNSLANMDLEVRDPVGGALFWRTPTVTSGGTFGQNINSVCNARTANAPTESAQWPAGPIPTGSYEILVYYQTQTDCPTTDPVTFNVNVTVDGRPLDPFQATLTQGQVFVGSFVVGGDGSTAKGLSGIDRDVTLPASPQDMRTNAQPLALDTPLPSFITSRTPYRAYVFDGRQNESVSIFMNARTGSLDPLLFLLDPSGNIVDTNDDANENTRDAAIQNRVLVVDGQYTIVATRYGQNLGGTEGDFDISLTTAVTSGNNTATLPNLPTLPTGSVQVSLQWNTNADLRLLVRDPTGFTVFDDVPVNQRTGARFVAAGNNVGCRTQNQSPVSYAYWPEGRLPAAGPYEIEVRFQGNCQDTRPVTFNLTVVANGQTVISTQGPGLAFALGERYITSFNIGTDGQVTAGEGGSFGTFQQPDAGALLQDVSSQIASARVVAPGETVSGSIRLNKKYDVYAFDGRANQVVTIGMEARNGTLDPTLFLLSPDGQQIAQNDDANQETTNSLINEFTLPADGRYIIIATHFGARYGVTAGDYTLTLRLNSP